MLRQLCARVAARRTVVTQLVLCGVTDRVSLRSPRPALGRPYHRGGSTFKSRPSLTDGVRAGSRTGRTGRRRAAPERVERQRRLFLHREPRLVLRTRSRASVPPPRPATPRAAAVVQLYTSRNQLRSIRYLRKRERAGSTLERRSVRFQPEVGTRGCSISTRCPPVAARRGSSSVQLVPTERY